jgi:TRAP-type C4-dicarboxylate transport system permease small subunit
MSQEKELVTMIWRFQRGLNMRRPRLRTTIKSVVAILCAACFLTMSLGSVSRAIAADTWETWPRITTVPSLVPNPETDANWSEKTGDAAGKETAKGRSSGKAWWIAAGTVVIIAIAIAAGGGGGGGSTPNPGHQ